ncbi:MAG: glycosyltransferase family 39 protein [Planctomycetota bacterium]
MNRLERNNTRRCFLVLLTVHLLLLSFNAWVHSPTLNEPGHAVAGMRHWETAEFSLYRVNPPLIRLVAGIPALFSGCEMDYSGYYNGIGARPVFDMGEDFIRMNGRASLLHFRLARLFVVPFSLLGAWICYAWGRDLYGDGAGLMACALWCFSPMVLGHGAMIAPDAHATSMGLAACYTFWRWLKRPTWRQAVVTGFVLGLAELSKTTMILFYPLWPILWLVYRWKDRRAMTAANWLSEALMLALRMVIGLYVLNLGYVGEGSMRQLKEFNFVSELFAGDQTDSIVGNRFKGSWLGEVPLPFPENYIIGIDVQQSDFENFSRPSYLRGRYQPKGWWYYYGYALLVKAPVGTLGLSLLAAVVTASGIGPRVPRRDLMILLAPAVIIFSVASSKFGFSHHSRYVLPCLPFVFIWISQLGRMMLHAFTAGRAKGWYKCLTHRGLASTRCWAGVLSFVLLGATVVGSLRVYPHSISYFNILAGGPKNGPEHLINSNVDWGQDLLFLEDWVEEQAGGLPVFLAFYNYYNPFDFELSDVHPWPFRKGSSSQPNIEDGFYAISVNLLYDFPWQLRLGKEHYHVDTRPMAHLRTTEPVGWAGYSVRIFSAQQLRDAYAAPEQPALWSDSDGNE